MLRRAAIILGVSIGLGLFEATQIYLFSWVRGRPIALSYALLDILTWLVLAVLVPAVLWISRHFPLLPAATRAATGETAEDGYKPWVSWAVHISSGLAFATIHLTGASLAFAGAMGMEDFGRELAGQFSLFFTLDVLTYCAIVGGDHALRHHRRAIEKTQENAELRGLLAETKLDALKRQLQPHFLFNTLNALSSFALRGDREVVVDSLARLSDLLRLTLDDTLEDEITLRQEVDILERYLSLQQIRFGDRLDVRLEIDPDTSDLLVPAMLLQPLVENALQHGISNVPGPGKVHVLSHRQNGDLHLEVLDNGPGFPATPGDQTRLEGIGLGNTRARLVELYGQRAVLELGGGDGGRVSVTIPARPAGSESSAGPPPQQGRSRG